MGSITATPPTQHPPSQLFAPLKLGNLTLAHRIVMAPMTRFRANDAHIPSPLAATFYGQRASVPGTLLITEATFISPRASGFPNTPGIFNGAQIAAWKTVTDAVHTKGSYIFLQLQALGRGADAALLKTDPDGPFDFVSSSATPIDSTQPVPRALSTSEIKSYIDDYATAARNAMEAGFDGVEIHGALGFLIDQFTQDVSNRRDDAYGGSVENRSRFALEVARAVVDAIGPDRVGVRLSPYSTFQGMKMADPVPQFVHLVQGLKDLGIAYLHLVESRVVGNEDVESQDEVVKAETLDVFVQAWGGVGPVLLAGGFTPESAKKAVDDEFKGKDVAIVFGRHFTANPDLPFRIANGIAFASYDRPTFYGGQEKGYTDFAFSDEFVRLQSKA
ncbi:hypothetical protein LTR84_010620 [Exophiala bonariae]|uniref:NADH:flavin oxidoreductase/NADH oxidase N-terminal domain-containing protein n=1 Tax=Exophiala bonariae TaxID=1690606 RepID=A0AAV9MVJ0_9EURO|nr:hypothetical protein LTR84_010620 [Exophiala bonariae]